MTYKPTYKIIATGSTGNAVLINGNILIDCGVPYKALSGIVPGLKIILLSHVHSDHFNASTIRRIARERPMLRFGCCRWLVKPLLDCGVSQLQIDAYEPDKHYCYSGFSLSPVALSHDVPNCGYKLYVDRKYMGEDKIFYATDTVNLDGIEAKDFDTYLIEANYEDDEIHERIKAKESLGIYPYETRVLDNHLSKAKADDFIIRNAGANSEYQYLHMHKE
jgi:ribonuclease BN (tRNA processing enzyme)